MSHRPSITSRERIEQAIARGWRIERICNNLDVDPHLVQAVWHAMDAAVAEDQPRVLGGVA